MKKRFTFAALAVTALAGAILAPAVAQAQDTTPGVSAPKVTHTAAYISLVLKDEHAKAMAIEGAESAEELHMTMSFLAGNAAKFTSEERSRIAMAVKKAVAVDVER